jgi:6-phosphogluconolactonase (cycloisomerase 2 family)
MTRADPQQLLRRSLRTLVLAAFATLLILGVPSMANAAPSTLTYQGCFTSDSDVAGCAQIAGAVAGGAETGLNALSAVALSADGESLYAASSNSDAVARFDRNPDTGELAYEDCITSDSNVAGCTRIAGATAFGMGTGLDGLISIAVSADGNSVYAASQLGNAVARFDRDPDTGELAYQGCISSDTDVGGCTPIPGAVSGGAQTALDAPFSVAVSADGTSVYSASEHSDAVARFDRDPDTGELLYQDCITSDSGVGGCTPIAGATAFGVGTGLDSLFSLGVSADGNSVYAASQLGDAVARFDRDPDTGELTYQDCITSDSNVAGCTPIAGATAFGVGTGLDGLISLAVSADAESLYAASYESDAVARFDRDPGTGALTYQGCITSDSGVGGCVPVPGATPFGVGTGLDGLFSVAASADGQRVYAASFDGDAVARFDRDPDSGALSYRGCIGSNTEVGACTSIPGATAGGANSGLDALRSIVVSADGTSVYSASFDGDAVARFDRDPPSNAFTFGRLKRNTRNGTAELSVKVPGPGVLILAGRSLRRAEREAGAAGLTKLPVRATGKAARQLRRRGEVRVSARVTYTPNGGTPNSKTTQLKLVRRL